MRIGWLADDLAGSIRRICRHPGNFVYPVLIVAVGVGSTVGAFNVAYQPLHGGLPYRHAERVAVAAGGVGELLYNSYEFQPNPASRAIFEKSAAYYYEAANLLSASGTVRIQIARVTPDFFTTLGVGLLGPGFSASIPPGPIPRGGWLPIVISDRLWRTYFASDRAILFHSLELDSYENHYQIAGIAPPGVSFPPGVDAWLPTYMRSWSIFENADPPASLGVIGLLRLGVSLKSAQAQIRAWPPPPWYGAEEPATAARLISLADSLGGELKHLGLILWLATIFFLVLTVMAALAIFQIDGEERKQELSIRAVLGASPCRLFASLSLSTALTLCSALLAGFLVRCSLLRISASYLSLPRGLPASVDGTSVAMALGVTAIVFVATIVAQGSSLVPDAQPASFISRKRRAKPVKHAIRPKSVTRPSFPVQTTLAAVVLIAAALLTRSAHNLMHVDPGLQPQKTFVCEIALSPSFGQSVSKPSDAKLPIEERRKAAQASFREYGRLLNTRFTLMLQHLGTNPVVDAAGLISVAPYRGVPAWDMDCYYSRTPWLPRPGQAPPTGILHHTLVRTMSPTVIPTLGMRLIYGRNFGTGVADEPTVIVNQALAESLGAGSGALGQYIEVSIFHYQGFPPARIIGITGNVRETGLYSPPQPTVYYPLSDWAQQNIDLVVRMSRDMSAEDVLNLIQASVRAVAPDASVSNFASMSERVQSAGRLTRYGAYYLLALALLSVFLAGTCAWARATSEIRRRKHEVGIRMALGGTPGNIAKLFLIKGLTVTAIAAAAGALIAWWFSHLLSYLFYGITLADPASYLVGVTTVVGFVFVVQTWSIRNALERNPGDLMREGPGL